MINHSDDENKCEACTIIDKLDGVQDNRLFHTSHWTSVVTGASGSPRQVFQERVSDTITKFSGSMIFVYCHLAWFGVWIAGNLGLLGESGKFDKYPFGLLTMIVSLEAIFLSTFVMISQNRTAERNDKRDQIDAESNIQSLIWLLHVAVAQGVDIQHVRSLCDHTVGEMRLHSNGENTK